MAYVPDMFKVTMSQLDDRLEKCAENITWVELLMIDYVYHHQDPDYDNGLSFLDRIHKKIGKFHPNWDTPTEMKNCIADSIDYTNEIKFLLKNPTDILYYGV